MASTAQEHRVKIGLFAFVTGNSKGRKKSSRGSRISGKKKRVKTNKWPSLSAVFVIYFFFASAVNLYDASSISGRGGASPFTRSTSNVPSAVKLSRDNKTADLQFSVEDMARPSYQSREEDLTRQFGSYKKASAFSSNEFLNVSRGGGEGGVRGRDGRVKRDGTFQEGKRKEDVISSRGVAMVGTFGEVALSNLVNTPSSEEHGNDHEEGVGVGDSKEETEVEHEHKHPEGNCSCDKQVVKVVAGYSLPEPDLECFEQDQGCSEQDQGESNSGSKKEYGFAEAVSSLQVGYTLDIFFNNIEYLFTRFLPVALSWPGLP